MDKTYPQRLCTTNFLQTRRTNKQTQKRKQTKLQITRTTEKSTERYVYAITKKHKYSPTTIISTKSPATQITYKKPYTKTQIDTNTDTDTNTETKREKTQTKTSWTRAIDEFTKL